MSTVLRHVFIISDLHLGGAPPTRTDRVDRGSDLHLGGAPPTRTDRVDRGFRMMSRPEELARFIRLLADRPPRRPGIELVINGDFIDFLAEPEEGPGNDEGEGVAPSLRWKALREDPRDAVRTLRTIASRPCDAEIFAALVLFLARGHRLTLLLGNHDIELSFPDVRLELMRLLQADEHAVRFIYDGEAYVVGDALIEHGNRYDRFNQVDHDALRRLRSMQSRRQPEARAKNHRLAPPPGSELVARVMNPIKRSYPFVDLLKPEVGATIPTLLALDPRYRGEIVAILRTLAPVIRRGMRAPALPQREGDIAAVHFMSDEDSGDGSLVARYHGADRRDELQLALNDVMGPQMTHDFLAALDHAAEHENTNGDIGWSRLLTARTGQPLLTRLPALLDALRTLQNDQSFSREVETAPEYIGAARSLIADSAFRYVVFGHTHLAKRVPITITSMSEEPFHGVYLNTGTWCDLIEVPLGVFHQARDHALAVVQSFATDLNEGRLGNWTRFRPTYVRLDLGDQNRVEEAALVDFAKEGLALGCR